MKVIGEDVVRSCYVMVRMDARLIYGKNGLAFVVPLITIIFAARVSLEKEKEKKRENSGRRTMGR